jgi:hypothetical protein
MASKITPPPPLFRPEKGMRTEVVMRHYSESLEALARWMHETALEVERMVAEREATDVD